MAESVSIRTANAGDCHTTRLWRNDESTRKWFGDTELVSPEHHREWFNKMLIDPSACMLVISADETPVCHVRLNNKGGGRWEMSVMTNPSKRRKGYGTAAIVLACQHALYSLGATVVLAFIKESNQASLKAFGNAGFSNLGLKDHGGVKSVEMRFGGCKT